MLSITNRPSIHVKMYLMRRPTTREQSLYFGAGRETLGAVYVYVLPWPEFPVGPSYPHHSQRWRTLVEVSLSIPRPDPEKPTGQRLRTGNSQFPHEIINVFFIITSMMASLLEAAPTDGNRKHPTGVLHS